MCDKIGHFCPYIKNKKIINERHNGKQLHTTSHYHFASITFLLLYPGHFFSPLGANVEDPFKSPAVPLKEFVTPAMGCFEILCRTSTK